MTPLTKEQLHLVALYGLCPDCKEPRKAVTEMVDGRWRYRMACGCNPPAEEQATKEDDA